MLAAALRFYHYYPRLMWSQLFNIDTDMAHRNTIPSLALVDDLEIKSIFLPLLGFLSLQYHSWYHWQTQLHIHTRGHYQPLPYLLGVVGGVGVGKTNFTHILQLLLQWYLPELTIAMVSTDGFIDPTVNKHQREAANVIERVGFAKGYDWSALLTFFHKLQQAEYPIAIPIYSHAEHGLSAKVNELATAADIFIMEGCNLLCPLPTVIEENSSLQPQVHTLADFFSCLIYLDADIVHIADWYLHRQSQFLGKDNINQELKTHWQAVWDKVHVQNLQESILPYQTRSHIILHKDFDHRINGVWLRNY